jgi:hypothetical protein
MRDETRARCHSEARLGYTITNPLPLSRLFSRQMRGYVNPQHHPYGFTNNALRAKIEKLDRSTEFDKLFN